MPCRKKGLIILPKIEKKEVKIKKKKATIKK